MSTTKKNKGAPLGKALIKSIQKKNLGTPHDDLAVFFQKSQTNDEYEKAQRMKSIIERDSMTEFLVEAQMSNKGFEADRNLKMKDIKEELMNKRIKQPGEVQKEIEALQMDRNRLLANLRIPRKPRWTKEDTKAGFLAKENQAFLDWRRRLAQVEEKQHQIKMTPFEKNIEVWKQLWRVVERAHVLIQIVDARDPMFYRCEDLDAYVKEVSPTKQNLLLINKSDLVSDELRRIWSEHLNERGISHLFFSAKIEQKKIDQAEAEVEVPKLGEIEQEEDQQEDEPKQKEQQSEQPVVKLEEKAVTEPEKEDQKLPEVAEHKPEAPKVEQAFLNTSHIASCADLISYINQLHRQVKELMKKEKPAEEGNDKFELEVGMVGYPNVGKSSVINSLFNKKKVGVASMPGKTKHYQTLYLTPQIVLCDCPGLVFPNVASTIAQMVLNGVIPIDNLREVQTPMQLLVQRISRTTMEEKYGLRFPDNIYTAETLLQGFANLKGFHTGRGLPNESVAARVILKDYTNGYLSHCEHPPGYKPNPEVEVTKPQDTEKETEQKKEVRNQRQFDQKFFEATEAKLNEQDEAIRAITTQQLLDLVQGNAVKGMKLRKDQRKQIKFAIKRGQTLEDIKKKYLMSKAVVQEGGHKQYIRS